MVQPARIRTIGDLIDIHYRLDMYCHAEGCTHGARVDLEALAERLGRDHSCGADALKARMRCSKCGEKEISFGVGYDFRHAPRPQP